jgi:hypothetical protein
MTDEVGPYIIRTFAVSVQVTENEFEELACRADFPYILEFAQTTREYLVSVEPDYFGGNEEAWMVTHTQRWFCRTQTAVRRPRNSTGFPP